MVIVVCCFGFLELLREFVKINNKFVWGICVGFVMLVEEVFVMK